MSHVTQTPLSRSKGQLAEIGDILWRLPAQLIIVVIIIITKYWSRRLFFCGQITSVTTILL